MRKVRTVRNYRVTWLVEKSEYIVNAIIYVSGLKSSDKEHRLLDWRTFLQETYFRPDYMEGLKGRE